MSTPSSLKGIILAGETGSRLRPLTRVTNKHLLPVYDRPMINYAAQAMVTSGIEDIMLVTGGTHAGEFLRLLGNGQDHGVARLGYAYQERAGGIAEALGLAARFADGWFSGDELADAGLGEQVSASSTRQLVQAKTHGMRQARQEPPVRQPGDAVGITGSWLIPLKSRTVPPILSVPSRTVMNRGRR